MSRIPFSQNDLAVARAGDGGFVFVSATAITTGKKKTLT